MTIPGIRLAADDAMEPTELLGLLIDWIDSDRDRLPASPRRLTGRDAYDTTALRTDLTRLPFLGGDEQPYFGTSDL